MPTKILRQRDPREDQLYQRGVNLCRELHLIPPAIVHVGLQTYICPPELLDHNGHIPAHLKLDKIIKPAVVYESRAHSWVRNAYTAYIAQMIALSDASPQNFYGEGGLYIRDQSAIDRSVAYRLIASKWVNTGTPSTSVAGIRFGTGTGAESFEDYILGAQIGYGTGVGQLSYIAQSLAEGSYDAPTKTFTAVHTRYANNNSGASIYLGEVGLFCTLGYYSSSSKYGLMCRDLIDPVAEAVAGSQIKCTYTFTLAPYPT